MIKMGIPALYEKNINKYENNNDIKKLNKKNGIIRNNKIKIHKICNP